MTNTSATNKGMWKTVDGKKRELLAELQLVKQTHVLLQQRLDFIRQMTDRCLLTGQESIPTALLDAMLNVNSPEQARHIVQQLQAEGKLFERLLLKLFLINKIISDE